MVLFYYTSHKYIFIIFCFFQKQIKTLNTKEDLKKLGLNQALTYQKVLQHLIHTLDIADQLNKELPILIHHWRTLDKNQNQNLERDELQNYLKVIRSDDKQRKDLEEQMHILRTNDYDRKNEWEAYSEMESFFEEITNNLFFHSEVFNLIRGDIPVQLRKGKTVTQIKISHQHKLYELHEKMKATPQNERDKYFRNHFFPAVYKSTDWSEILKVTACDHCDYR
jgi:hypothetical protein